jgi:hypothetical protein
MRKSEKRVKSSSRRNFLKGVTIASVAGISGHSSSARGIEKESLAPASAALQSQKDKKFIAILRLKSSFSEKDQLDLNRMDPAYAGIIED